MKAILYRASIPRYLISRALGRRLPTFLSPLRLVEVPPPVPPEGWIRVKVRLAGICGSDIALITGKSSPRLAPFFSFPAVLGHEILGEAQGQRVVVNPLLACRERGLSLCPRCQEGEEGLCLNVAKGAFAPGMLGYCRDLPGGWAEEMVAHPRRIHPVPGDVPDERAVLAEPLAVALRGLRLLEPDPQGTLLIIGAGTLGLLSLFVLKLQGHRGTIAVVARYGEQMELARAFGADSVVPRTSLVAAPGTKVYRAPLRGVVRRGGFSAVVVAAGSPSALGEALWAVGEGGKVLLLGGVGMGRWDLSPLWFRGVEVIGSYTYSTADFERAVELLPQAVGIERIVTHIFPLEEWPRALAVLREHRGIKVCFRP